MQAQATRTETQSITATQSLAAVQTMLRAGLGCITFLRDLLPEENFTQSHLVADEDSSISYRRADTNTSFSSASSKQSRGANGFKITVEVTFTSIVHYSHLLKTMIRGYSDEGDKILNYLENGIFDALQKEYLKSFIFAIYLDQNDPNNIVEAYTFNFQYHLSPESGIRIPIMTLGDNLQHMSLNNSRDNPVTEAAKKGRAPTLLDVKKSVKALLKTLIHATTQMDVLPSECSLNIDRQVLPVLNLPTERRYATFKLFYTDKTPVSYEPPHFQAGDEEKDRWYFMTHDLDEVPDKWSIGKVNTGHHSVNLSVTSIATYIPSSSMPDSNVPLGSTVMRPPAGLTPVQEANIRAAQAEQQISDARSRTVAWSGDESVELGDADGEGEDDPEYVRLPDGTYKKIASSAPVPLVPSGIKNKVTGDIEPLCVQMDVEEAQFAGVSERLPTKLNELNREIAKEKSNIEQTQVVEDLYTQDVPMPSPSPDDTSSMAAEPIFHSTGSCPSWSPPSASAPTSVISRQGSDIDMDMLKEVNSLSSFGETQPLDMETQVEPIESFDDEPLERTEEDGDTLTRSPAKEKRGAPLQDISDKGLECECGIDIEDECCFCEGGCGRWYHVWCMGYHSIDDPRMPAKFCCFSCRVQSDSSWPIIKNSLFSSMLSKFQDLALFRRAIKFVEKRSGLVVISDFTKANCTSRDVSRRLFGRLEREGFLVLQTTTLDDLGFPQTGVTNTRNKGKQTKPRKNVQAKIYLFNRESLKSVKYAEYFNPDPIVEARILKFAEMTSRLKAQKKVPGPNSSNITGQISLEDETQTQAETQMIPRDSGQKRTIPAESDGTPKPKKKVKISITHGLDLAE